MEIGWFEKKIGMGMCYGFNRRTGRTEWNGRASAQVRRGGVAGLFLLIISRFGRFAVRSDGVDRG